jgi:hypothetical protein
VDIRKKIRKEVTKKKKELIKFEFGHSKKKNRNETTKDNEKELKQYECGHQKRKHYNSGRYFLQTLCKYESN